ncbi:MAG: hypothetical protein QW303_01050 [Nitrososphaerota archaeon]
MSIRSIASAEIPRRVIAEGGVEFSSDTVYGKSVSFSNRLGLYHFEEISVPVNWDSNPPFGNILVGFEVIGRTFTVYISSIISNGAPAATSTIEIGLGALPNWVLQLLTISVHGDSFIHAVHSGVNMAFSVFLQNTGSQATSRIVLTPFSPLTVGNGIVTNSCSFSFKN